MTGVGSVPWFCAVWWLLLSLPTHGLAWLTFWIGPPVWPLTKKLIRWANTFLALSMKCAGEAGMGGD